MYEREGFWFVFIWFSACHDPKDWLHFKPEYDFSVHVNWPLGSQQIHKCIELLDFLYKLTISFPDVNWLDLKLQTFWVWAFFLTTISDMAYNDFTVSCGVLSQCCPASGLDSWLLHSMYPPVCQDEVGGRLWAVGLGARSLGAVFFFLSFYIRDFWMDTRFPLSPGNTFTAAPGPQSTSILVG